MGKYKDDVVYLNANKESAVSFFYFPEDERQPVRYYADGTKVPAPPAGPSHFDTAKNFTNVYFYADGSLKTFESNNADGSHVLLNFASATESGKDGTVTFGVNSLSHGKLTSYNYTSPDQAHLTGNETPFQVIETFEDGHLTKYQLDSLSKVGKASLTGTYSLTDHTSDLTLTTANLASPKVLHGTGQIDALVDFRAETLISQDGSGLISQDGSGFKLISQDGAGLISQDGSGWSVISNDGSGLKTTNLISQDGSGLNLLDVNALISQDGSGLIATGAGNLIGQDGTGIISRDGASVISHDAGGLLGLGLNGAALIAGGATQLFGNTGASIIGRDGASFGKSAVASAASMPAQQDVEDIYAFFGSGSRSYQELLDKGEKTPVDLTITTAFLNANSAHLGDTVNVSWQVKNLGPGATDPSTSKIYLSTDKSTATHADDVLIGSEVDPALVKSAASSDTYDYTLPSTLTPGTYYVYVVANGAGQFAESGTQANNYSSLMTLKIDPASPNPDLTPVGIILNNSSTSPATGDAGGTINVSYGLKENNQVAAGASTSGVYLSTDSKITKDDVLIGSLPEGAVKAGTNVISGGDFKLPTDIATGNYYVGVIVDSGDAVKESNEANNASSGYAIHVNGKSGPDLRVENLTVTGASPNPGEYASIAFDVNNTGTQDVRASNTKIYLSKDATLSSDDTLLRSYDEQLVEHGSGNHRVFSDIAIPGSVKPGSYYVIATADGDKTVAEVSETNNSAVAQLNVTTPLPDLSFFTGEGAVSLDTASVAAGGSDAFSYYVVNNGKANADPSQTRIYLSTDATITTSDTVLATVDTPSLGTASGSNYHYETANFVLPTALKPGTYYVGAITDYQGYRPESNEDNNVSGTVKLTVKAAAAPTVTLDAIATDGTVNLAEMKSGVTVKGTTTGVEDGQTVTVTLKTAKGAALGSAEATVTDGAFSVSLAGIDPTSLVASGLLKPNGSFSLSASVANDVGESASVSKTAAYDFQPPTLAVAGETVVLGPTGYAVALAGTSDLDQSSFLYLVDNNSIIYGTSVGAGGGWSVAYPPAGSTRTLAYGVDHELTMVGYDAAQNVAQTPVALSTTAAGAVTTGSGADTLIGNASANIFDGGAGHDTLIGAGGRDKLAGGADDDTFAFKKATDSKYSSPDTITDFSHNHDRIDLHSIDTNLHRKGDQAFHFIGTDAFTKPDPHHHKSASDYTYVELQIKDVGSATRITADMNHNGKADSGDFSIVVNDYPAHHHVTLDKGDFIL